MNIHVDSTAATRFLEKFAQFAAVQKKDVHALFEQQCRGIAKNLFAITPPMGGTEASVKLPKPGQKSRGVRIDWKGGLNAGRAAIGRDFEVAFSKQSEKQFQRLVQQKKADANQGQFSWVKSWYNANLSNRKRAKSSKLPVPASVIRQMQKYIYSKQGWVPAGWLSAAQRLGVVGVPGWISRHGSNGDVDFQNDKEFMYFEALNRTSHRNSKKIERNMMYAVEMQSNVIGRWLKDRAEKLAKGRIS